MNAFQRCKNEPKVSYIEYVISVRSIEVFELPSFRVFFEIQKLPSSILIDWKFDLRMRNIKDNLILEPFVRHEILYGGILCE